MPARMYTAVKVGKDPRETFGEGSTMRRILHDVSLKFPTENSPLELAADMMI